MSDNSKMRIKRCARSNYNKNMIVLSGAGGLSVSLHVLPVDAWIFLNSFIQSKNTVLSELTTLNFPSV